MCKKKSNNNFKKLFIELSQIEHAGNLSFIYFYCYIIDLNCVQNIEEMLFLRLQNLMFLYW